MKLLIFLASISLISCSKPNNSNGPDNKPDEPARKVEYIPTVTEINLQALRSNSLVDDSKATKVKLSGIPKAEEYKIIYKFNSGFNDSFAMLGGISSSSGGCKLENNFILRDKLTGEHIPYHGQRVLSRNTEYELEQNLGVPNCERLDFDSEIYFWLGSSHEEPRFGLRCQFSPTKAIHFINLNKHLLAILQNKAKTIYMSDNIVCGVERDRDRKEYLEHSNSFDKNKTFFPAYTRYTLSKNNGQSYSHESIYNFETNELESKCYINGKLELSQRIKSCKPMLFGLEVN